MFEIKFRFGCASIRMQSKMETMMRWRCALAMFAILPGYAMADPLTVEDQFFAGFYRSITATDAGQAIPKETSVEFANCVSKVVSSFISDDVKKLAEADFAAGRASSPELQARMMEQIVRGLTRPFMLGKDLLIKECPAVATEYRKHLKS